MPCGSRPLLGSSKINSGGSAHQRGRQAQPLAHPLRVGADRSAIGGVESDLLQRRTDPGPAHLSWAAVGPRGVEDGEVGCAGQMWVGAGTLHQRADAWQHALARGRHRHPQHLRLASGRQHQSKQHPQCCRLAGAVGSEESIHVAGADLEVHRVDGPQVAISLGQPLGTDDLPVGHGRGGHSPAKSSAAARCNVSEFTVPASRNAPRRPRNGVIKQSDGTDGRQGSNIGELSAATIAELPPQRPGDLAAQRQSDQGGRAAPVDADGARVLTIARAQAGQGSGEIVRRERVRRRGDVDGLLVVDLYAFGQG